MINVIVDLNRFGNRDCFVSVFVCYNKVWLICI